MSIDVSVIIPTFRRPQELVEAISSALQDPNVAVEIIVVDDSPEGSAEEAVKSLGDPRIRYIKNPIPSRGVPGVVRNIGWPLARGRFLHFLDDDDIVAEGHYQAVTAAFASNPGVGLVFGRIEPFGSGPTDQLDHERRYFADSARKAASSGRFGSRVAFTARMLFGNALLVCSSSVIRRECMVRLGGFDPSIRFIEDADYHLRAMRECGVRYLDQTAIRYRISSPSIMHSPNPTEEQRRGERLAHKQMQAKYLKARGALEYYALALFSRTVLKFY